MAKRKITCLWQNNLPLRLIGERLTFETNAYPFLKSEESKALAAEMGKNTNICFFVLNPGSIIKSDHEGRRFFAQKY